MTPAEITAICEETRWLGDLYQAAFVGDPAGPVKRNALVQTPDYVGDFLLARSLEPALAEFGVTPGLRLLDPCCGTGHLLLQSLARLFIAWQQVEPGRAAEGHVRRSLDSIHGVDCDPCCVVLTKLRLLRAALRLCGRETLPREPFPLHIAWADSLLPPEHALQPQALLDEVRRLRKVCGDTVPST